MRVYKRFDFVAWEESGETALALIDDNYWFNMALNCKRDGDMGEKDDDGIYERAWATDFIYESERQTVRPMTSDEVRLYQHKVDVFREYIGEACDAVLVWGSKSYMLIEQKQ